MIDKKFVSGMIVMAVIISGITILTPTSNSSTPPPTKAITTIYIFNNGTVPMSSEDHIIADNYNFLAALGTDGSININVTSFP